MQIFLHVPQCGNRAGIVSFLQNQLKINGRAVTLAADADDMISMSKHCHHDVVVLIIDESAGNPYEVLGRLKQNMHEKPVICLTRNENGLTLFNCVSRGALSAITYDEEVLSGNTFDILLRNTYLATNYTPQIKEYGPMTINHDRRQVTVNDEAVKLTSQEFQLLELLSMREGKLATREFLFESLYPSYETPDLQIIQVYICKLRKKLSLNQDGLGDCIDNHWGQGYMLLPWSEFSQIIDEHEEANIIELESKHPIAAAG